MATVIEDARPRARAARSKIYVGLALMIAAIVFVGFSRSFYGTLFADAAHPWIIHVHAAVYVGWLALLIAQTVLAARGDIATHRRVGKFGIAYGALVWVLGLIVSIAIPVFDVHSGQAERGEQFLAIPLGDMVLFGGFFGAAIAYRRKPEIHKRLIILAAVAVMFAAVGRALTNVCYPDRRSRSAVGRRPRTSLALVLAGDRCDGARPRDEAAHTPGLLDRRGRDGRRVLAGAVFADGPLARNSAHDPRAVYLSPGAAHAQLIRVAQPTFTAVRFRGTRRRRVTCPPLSAIFRPI